MKTQTRRRFTSVLDLRLSAEQLEAIHWWADQVGCSVSQLVRELLPSRKPRRGELADVAEEIEQLRRRLDPDLVVDD